MAYVVLQKVDMLAPGNYKLTADLSNPRPDRRKTTDWTAVPTWKAGMEFLVVDIGREGCLCTVIKLVGNRWTYQMIGPTNEEQNAALERALAPTTESHAAMFTAMGVDDYFAKWLVESGRLDRELFRKLWGEYLKDGDTTVGAGVVQSDARLVEATVDTSQAPGCPPGEKPSVYQIAMAGQGAAYDGPHGQSCCCPKCK